MTEPTNKEKLLALLQEEEKSNSSKEKSSNPMAGLGGLAGMAMEMAKQAQIPKEPVIQTVAIPPKDFMTPGRIAQEALLKHTVDPLGVYIAIKLSCSIQIDVKEVMFSVPRVLTSDEIIEALKTKIDDVSFAIKLLYIGTPYGDGHIFVAFGHHSEDPNQFIAIAADTLGNDTTFRYAGSSNFNIQSTVEKIAESLVPAKE